MSPAAQLVVYVAAVVCFLLAAWGYTGNARHPVSLGWLGLALVTIVLLVGAFEAL